MGGDAHRLDAGGPERHKEQTRAPLVNEDGYVAGLPLLMHRFADR